MQFDTEELIVSTTEPRTVHNLTDGVESLVDASDITQGICQLYCPHTTAAITINEDDPALHNDFLDRMGGLIPPDAHYQHGDKNADAHILSMLLGASATVPVTDNVLALGTWQSVLLIESDGPRDRTILVRLLGD